MHFFHAATGVGEVDIWNVTEGQTPGILFDDIELGEDGGTVDVPAGAYTLGVDVGDDGVPDLYFEIPAQTAGTVANLFIIRHPTWFVLVAPASVIAATFVAARRPACEYRSRRDQKRAGKSGCAAGGRRVRGR